MPITIPIKGITIAAALGPRFRGVHMLSSGATHILIDDRIVCRSRVDPTAFTRVERVSKKSLCHRCRRQLKAAGIIA